jgi:hypothetical protein
MNTTIAEPRLTSSQVEAFRHDGYIIYNQPVLPQDKFNGLKNYFEKMLGDLPEGERPEAMDVPHFMHPELLKWACSDPILDLVEPIIGPDIALFSTHFICKPKGNGRRVPWHEDSAYWRGQIDPMEVVTVWFAIDPSVRENGCMMVIPETHRIGQRGFSDYDAVDSAKNVFPTEIIEKHRDEDKRVYVELQPNQCSLHDARIQHGSEPNTSNLRRCGYTMRFTSTAVKFCDFKGMHQVYLARGQDRGGNTYADQNRAYPEIHQTRMASSKYKHSH